MKSSKSNTFMAYVILASFCFLIFLLVFYTKTLTYTEHTTIKVERKESVFINKRTTFLIYTNKETLKIDDTFFTMNFNSSDDYHKIKEGSCYNVKLRGKRVGFLSWFRNIEKYEQVSCKE